MKLALIALTLFAGTAHSAITQPNTTVAAGKSITVEWDDQGERHWIRAWDDGQRYIDESVSSQSKNIHLPNDGSKIDICVWSFANGKWVRNSCTKFTNRSEEVQQATIDIQHITEECKTVTHAQWDDSPPTCTATCPVGFAAIGGESKMYINPDLVADANLLYDKHDTFVPSYRDLFTDKVVAKMDLSAVNYGFVYVGSDASDASIIEMSVTAACMRTY